MVIRTISSGVFSFMFIMFACFGDKKYFVPYVITMGLIALGVAYG